MANKTYAEYLKESKKQTFSKYMMPPNARPKYSRGDNPLERERRKETARRGLVDVKDLPITKEGTINKKKMRPIRQKIYKVQEASHGR